MKKSLKFIVTLLVVATLLVGLYISNVAASDEDDTGFAPVKTVSVA